MQAIDAQLSGAVKTSLLRHSWYLTQQLVVLALFDTSVGRDTRTQMAVRLHGIPRPDRFPLGKPLFPDQQLSRDHPELVDMVGPNSWLIFELLDCQGGWLSQNPAEWDNDDEYVRMYGIVRHLAVVNDTAER